MNFHIWTARHCFMSHKKDLLDLSEVLDLGLEIPAYIYHIYLIQHQEVQKNFALITS